MRVHNIRLGHACNSSSTHSILIFRKGMSLPEQTHDGYDYGWDDFTLVEPQAKAAYSWLLMAHSMGPDMADLILKGVGIKKPQDLGFQKWDDYSYEGYIDHQSIPTMPRTWDGALPDVAYAQDVVRFINRKNAVILGGNDNSEGHPMVQRAMGGDDEARSFRYNDRHALLRDTSLGRFTYTDDIGGSGYSGVNIARKDGDMWTLFNRGSGNRMSVSFNDKAMPERLNAPMLVDIKVTDYCAMGCPFCYQGSTTEGQHASKEYINSLIYELTEAKCFEIAFGGGEPTEHPNFSEFVLSAQEHGIVPNVTSRNPAWFTAKKNQKAVQALGAVAFSAETVTQLKKWLPFLELREKWDDYYFKATPTVQVIDGAVRYDALLRIWEFAKEHRMRMTILGWKTTGRANNWQLRDQGKWLEWFKGLNEYEQRDVAVDTVIVQQYKDEFEKMGVAPESYIDHEGTWSCYVNAVGKVIAPSSYGTVDTVKSLPLAHELVESFRSL